MFHARKRPLRQVITNFGGALLRLLNPEGAECRFCRSVFRRGASSSGLGLCRECEESIPWIKDVRCPVCGRYEDCYDCVRREETYFVRNRSAVKYDERMKDWLARYKYRGDERLAGLMADVLLHAYRLHEIAEETASHTPQRNEASAAMQQSGQARASSAIDGFHAMQEISDKTASSIHAQKTVAPQQSGGSNHNQRGTTQQPIGINSAIQWLQNSMRDRTTKQPWRHKNSKGAGPNPIRLLTFVPLSESRWLDRGFNQAEQMARELGNRLGLTVIPLLQRDRHTEKQSLKTRGARLRDMRGLFSLSEAGEKQLESLCLTEATAATLHIYIVDDVYTTGSTLNECAKAIATGIGQITRADANEEFIYVNTNVHVYGLTFAR